MRFRALSTAIAGIIVIAFLLVAVVPLLISIYQGTISAHLALNSELNRKIGAAAQTLNITFDPLSSNDVEKHYVIKNTGPKDIGIKFYIITDSRNMYIVKAGDTVNNDFLVNNIVIRTKPLPPEDKIALKNDTIVVKAPLGKALVIVKNGELLGSILTSGVYVHAIGGTSASRVTYAEIAKSLKIEYFNLTPYKSIGDLLRSGSLIVSTDISAKETDENILNSGVISSYCFNGSPTQMKEGGFTPTIDREELDAVFIHNLGPMPGMIILGGNDPDYKNESIHVSLYEPYYYLAPFKSNEPGIIAMKTTNDNKPVICISWFTPDNKSIAHYCWPEDTGNTLRNKVEESLLRNSVEVDESTPTDNPFNVENADAKVLVSPSIGVIAWLQKSDGKITTVYCPPDNYTIDINTMVILPKPDGCAVLTADNTYMYKAKAGSGITITLKSMQVLVDGGYMGSAETTININSENIKLLRIGSRETNNYPRVLKISNILVNKTLLLLHTYLLDNENGLAGREKELSGVNAFGVYYYSGYLLNISVKYEKLSTTNISKGNPACNCKEIKILGIKTGIYKCTCTPIWERYTYSYIYNLYGIGGKLSVFDFQQGTSSGLRPFTVIADTDGNGLAELIFTDEWFKPGLVLDLRNLFIEMAGVNIGAKSYLIYDFSDVLVPGSDLVPQDIYQWLGSAFGLGLSVDSTFYHPVYGGLEMPWYGCVDNVSAGFVYFKFMGRSGEYGVNGTNAAEIALSLRYSFHDSVGGGTSEVLDPKKGIWGVFAVDDEGFLGSSYVYLYDRMHDLGHTWPPSNNFVSDTVYLPLPRKPRLYYVAFGISDPYYYTRASGTSYKIGYINDVDFTIRIEGAGMWYLHR
ncbi:hypothetical protein PYJP_02110 [Pyrofollis japonicus]|uniref:hypothetical protein n=1 Tax=Pyrofollis japonicus TaxID=3060460 RepID=UPI00295AB2E8|nr:hypothetical protein [Pyrofollis japonicus]BEP16859.1 hypothetical protein PYJP_02110 [Pyrofollis japonicus]